MSRANPTFSMQELRRVGVAATLIVFCGTIVIVAVTLALGHYSTLSHCGPKAVLDGAVVALLMGRSARWRCLALLGAVYGFVLLFQVGVFYLLPVMAIAGAIGAIAGWTIAWMNRTVAVGVAAAVYELLCGFGTPIQIYFATGGRHEPIIWGLWFAEWPLRIGGALIGAWGMARWVKSRGDTTPSPSIDAVESQPTASKPSRIRQTRSWRGAAVRVGMCIVACTLPMAVDRAMVLGVIAAVFVVYAWGVGMRWRILHAAAGLAWGWAALGLMSYLWHRDIHSVLDLGRTLVLRFVPLTLASMTLASTVRPVDLFRLLRKAHVGGAVLIPLAAVVRNLPRSRRLARQSIAELKARGSLNGRLGIFRRPLLVGRTVLGAQLRLWSEELAEETESRQQRSTSH